MGEASRDRWRILGGVLVCASVLVVFATAGLCVLIESLGLGVQHWVALFGGYVAVMLALLGAAVYAHLEGAAHTELHRVERALRKLTERNPLPLHHPLREDTPPT